MTSLDYGYPTEGDLAALHTLATHNALVAGGIDTLLDHLCALWWRYDLLISWTPDTGTLELHTGGWSGNETIIETLRKTPFWALSWRRIERGGHYYLRVPAIWNPHMREGKCGTRLIRVETCGSCPHTLDYRGCGKMPYKNKYGATKYREFEDSYPAIPDWCPLEQEGPDWRPPATIDLYGPPRYARNTTDGRRT